MNYFLLDVNSNILVSPRNQFNFIKPEIEALISIIKFNFKSQNFEMDFVEREKGSAPVVIFRNRLNQ